eukprot:scaffold4945_cov57-Phaeocystis_antarctica.AAC.3
MYRPQRYEQLIIRTNTLRHARRGEPHCGAVEHGRAEGQEQRAAEVVGGRRGVRGGAASQLLLQAAEVGLQLSEEGRGATEQHRGRGVGRLPPLLLQLVCSVGQRRVEGTELGEVSQDLALRRRRAEPQRAALQPPQQQPLELATRLLAQRLHHRSGVRRAAAHRRRAQPLQLLPVLGRVGVGGMHVWRGGRLEGRRRRARERRALRRAASTVVAERAVLLAKGPKGWWPVAHAKSYTAPPPGRCAWYGGGMAPMAAARPASTCRVGSRGEVRTAPSSSKCGVATLCCSVCSTMTRSAAAWLSCRSRSAEVELPSRCDEVASRDASGIASRSEAISSSSCRPARLKTYTGSTRRRRPSPGAVRLAAAADGSRRSAEAAAASSSGRASQSTVCRSWCARPSASRYGRALAT